MSISPETKVKQAPAAPGVYFFRDSAGRFLYIGKSADLKARLASYFQEPRGLSPFKETMIEQIADVRWRRTESEIEALILESRLIKKHRPKYNILLRDDKNYFFVGLESTKENFPRVIITHQPFTFAPPELGSLTSKWKLSFLTKNTGYKIPNTKYKFIGPFTDGKSLKITLRKLRKIFPYRACKNPIHKPCLHYDLGLCPAHIRIYDRDGKKSGAMIKNEIAAVRKKYNRDLKSLFAVLRGTKTNLLRDLKKEMAKTAKLKEYEKAAEARDQISYLENILAHERVLSPEIIRRETNWPEIEKELHKILKTEKPLNRIEAYDVSNISGKFAVGSMVVFMEDKPDKSQYRRFRVKTVKSANDTAMMKEILTRRLNHLPPRTVENNLAAWPAPDLVIVDGGKPQLGAAMKVWIENKISVPLLALAKREEEIFLPREKNSIKLSKYSLTLNFIRAIRNEAHRFAINYYRKLHKQGSGLK